MRLIHISRNKKGRVGHKVDPHQSQKQLSELGLIRISHKKALGESVDQLQSRKGCG
jgi:hypothetical protein